MSDPSLYEQTPPKRSPVWAIALVIAAALGLFFTSFSTYDFAMYLDRQVHGIHCSFIPGLGGTDVSGTSGCHVTLMSPYSSVLRRLLWGGLPVSLPGMAVFALLLYRGLDLLIVPARRADKAVTGVVLGMATVPLITSVVMGSLALVVLDAACKLCIGTYISSALVFAAALAIRLTMPTVDPEEQDDDAPRSSAGKEAIVGLLQLGVFVLLPTAAWAGLMPDHDAHIGTCGTLPAPEDKHGMLVDLEPGGPGAKPAIEVLDPLCPSCKGLEDRLAVSGHGDRLKRQAVLFPLDQTCNWMVGATMHPGACTISEAVLCAEDRGHEVIDWAYAHQAEIRDASAADPKAAAAKVTAAFPEVADCIGKPAVRARLNHGLRWAVKNELPVLTPQLFIDGQRVCDADTDLGLDYALERMLAGPATASKEAP